MAYTDQAQNAQGQAPTIRSMITAALEGAERLDGRVQTFNEMFFGSAPKAVATGLAGASVPAPRPPIELELTRLLEAIARVEAGLDRLGGGISGTN